MPPEVAHPISHTSTVTPDQIDELGHMNVRWYGHNALQGTNQISERLGLDQPSLLSSYTRHHHEQLVGSELEVRSALLSPSLRGKLRIFHELRNRADGDLAATFIHELDRHPVESPGVELPEYGQPRSISLDFDRLATAPALQQVQDRGLAMRYEREVTTDDTMGAEVLPSWLATNLIWGGERPGGDGDWIRTLDSGDRMAYATMESRLWIGQLPALGTRIQSFGAVIAIGDKISHGLNWAYDLDTGKVLAVFEVINLAFNINARSSMVIPPAMRELELERFHPDLAAD